MADEKQILKALSELYISIFEFDLHENTLEPYKTNPFIEMWSEGFKTAQDKTSHVMRNIAKPECVNDLLDFVRVTDLADRMGDQTEISHVFEGLVNGWCKARFIVVDRGDDGKPWHVLYTVETVPEYQN